MENTRHRIASWWMHWQDLNWPDGDNLDKIKPSICLAWGLGGCCTLWVAGAGTALPEPQRQNIVLLPHPPCLVDLLLFALPAMRIHLSPN